MADEKRIRISGVADVFPVGKTKLRIFTDGCVYCGKDTAPAWHFDRTVTVIVGTKEQQIEIKACDDCVKPQKAGD